MKTGQVISTRVDLFPEQYTSRLSSLQDDLDPMPAAQIKAVVEREVRRRLSLRALCVRECACVRVK